MKYRYKLKLTRVGVEIEILKPKIFGLKVMTLQLWFSHL